MGEPNQDLDFSYDSYLAQVPQSIRDQIEPAFKEYSEKIQQNIGTTYGALDPYKEIVDGWQPEHVQAGLSLLTELNQNPQRIYDALIAEYPQLAGQVQQQQLQTPPQFQQPGHQDNDFNLPPEFLEKMTKMEQVVELLFQNQQRQENMTAQQQQAAQEAQMLADMNAELDKIAPTDKYPREFILSYVARGMDIPQAVQAYTQWEQQRFQQSASAATPLVAPGNGGGVPSHRIDTSKLSDEDRKQLLVQALMKANQEG